MPPSADLPFPVAPTSPLSGGLLMRARLVEAAAMAAVAAVSLLLVLFVAFGDARRASERFQFDKLTAQAEIARGAVETFVRPGLSLRHFVGFESLAQSIRAADPAIIAVEVHDRAGVRLFGAGAAEVMASFDADTIKASLRRQSATAFQVVVPIRDRFGIVGHVIVEAPRAIVAERAGRMFAPLVAVMLGLALVAGFGVIALPARLGEGTRSRLVAAGFVVCFLAGSAIAVSTLVSFYAQGSQARATSLAEGLAQRVDDIVVYGLTLDDVSGLDELLADYLAVNPDIRAAALLVDGRVHAQAGLADKPAVWTSRPSDFEYTRHLEGGANRFEVRVAVPGDVVFGQTLRSVRNFAALLFASALIALLMRRFVGTLVAATSSGVTAGEAATDRIKLVFFLGVFAEHLCYPFLPQFVQASTTAAGLPSSFLSAPFAAYFLAFAAVLVPAGFYAAAGRARLLLAIGLTACLVGALVATWSTSFVELVGARLLCGMGQGTVLVAVQSLLQAAAPAQARTRAGGAVVFGFQAGMIAGMALGSLMVALLGPAGVFVLAAAVGATAILLVAFLPRDLAGAAMPTRSLTADWMVLSRSRGFLGATLFVGIPAKAVQTGVVLFGLPLVLSADGLGTDDIGQIIMLYGIAVIGASALAARNADSRGETLTVLRHGTLLSAMGLSLLAAPALVRLCGIAAEGTIPTALVVFGAVMVGAGQGFINAPVVVHAVDQVRAAVEPAVASAAYRLFERVGHVAGPLVVAQLMAGFGVSGVVFGLVALVVLATAAYALRGAATGTSMPRRESI